MTVPEKLKALRALMKAQGVSAYIIPSSDYHQSEYTADHWKSRRWISGFTGSAGTVVVTGDKAGLWTDGRYFIQAEAELEGSGIALFRMFDPGVPSYQEWIAGALKKGDKAGFDGRVVSAAGSRSLLSCLTPKGIGLDFSKDLVGDIWTDRPALPSSEVFVHETEFAGESRTEKLARVRAEMADKGATVYLLTTLDDIAWLYNLRGGDVDNCPVFSAFALITGGGATLFTDKSRLSKRAAEALEKDGITVDEYANIEQALKRLGASETVLYDPAKTAVSLTDAMTADISVVEMPQVVKSMKSVKSKAEIAGLIKAQIRDSAAVVKFLAWLDDAVKDGGVTEISAAEKIREFRSRDRLFMGTSFNTIAGYGAHAAMMHYSATPESDADLSTKGMLLIDSGGQYPDGTTDITRTVALGPLSKEEKKDFTLVLKSHIALASARFPAGTVGAQLDALARAPIWEHRMDYGCGTGHGVGYFLSVHEGPQNLSPRDCSVRFEPGMNITIEPGIYKKDTYGIRTENMYYVAEDASNEFGAFLRFETLTWAPIDIRGIDVSMLTEKERVWINDYHAETFRLIAPLCDDAEKIWLEKATKKI